MTKKLAKTDVVGILAEEIKAATEAEGRVTKKYAEQILNAVEETVARILVDEQAGFALGGIGQFKLDVKPEKEYNVPSTDPEAEKRTVVKPEHLAAKFVLSKPFRTELAEADIKA